MSKTVCFALLSATLLILASPALAYRLEAPGGGGIHALVVGVNAYPKLVGHDLKGALDDAKGIERALEDGGVKDLETLFDQQATRANFVAAMNRLVSISKPGDLVFISYAGHGLRVPEYDQWRGLDPGGANEEIALSGFGQKSPDSSEVVVNVEVRAWLSRLNAKGVDTLVVWDSCYGGGMRNASPTLVRQLRVAPDAGARKNFVSIDMTSMEARANVKAMEHVTFLAGADPFSSVPELTGVDPENPGQLRGALSFYVSRALRGQLVSGRVSRLDLFDTVKQKVREASQKLQAIEVTPQSENPAVSGRTVLVIDDAAPRPERVDDPVRLAIVDGPPGAFDSVVKQRTGLTLVDDAKTAELVWNVPKRQAKAHDDVLMENINQSMIGAIADRIRTLTRLRALGERRTLTVKAGEDGKAFVPPNFANAIVDGLAGEKLTVFNIAADATVQMLLPAAPSSRGICPNPEAANWECKLDVTTPFGIDTVVAVAAKETPKELVDWLRRHHGQRDAVELPPLLEDLAQQDGSLRLGFAEVVTAPTN